MNILSWCKIGYKTERECIHEIPSGKFKMDRNRTFKKIIPLILHEKNKGENLSDNYSQTEQIQFPSFININKNNNNYYSSKSINNSKYSDYTCDKDFALQIKKIVPVELPTDNDLDDDIIIKEYQNNIGFFQIGEINQRYDKNANYKIKNESKDSYLNIMNLKNMLSESFKEKEIFINNELFKEDASSFRSSNNINNEFIIKNKSRNRIKKSNKNKKNSIMINHKNTFIYNNRNNTQKNLNFKFDNKKRNTDLIIKKKFMKKLLINQKQKSDFNKSNSLIKTKNNNKSKNKKSIDHSNAKNDIQKKDISINKILNLHKPFTRKNLKTIYLTEYSSRKYLKKSNYNNDNILKNNRSLNIIKEITRSPNLRVQGRNNTKKNILQLNSNISNSNYFYHQTNRQSSIENSSFKIKMKVTKLIHKNISSVFKFNEKNSKHNTKKRKTKNKIVFDNPFAENYNSNYTQKTTNNEHINRVAINCKVNKLINNQSVIKKDIKALNSSEKAGKKVILNI